MPIDLEHWQATLTSSRTLWIVLWSGVALLTVALIVISRTRWGQARPTSKCVVLSVFAHLLLIGYAYKTQLFDVYPAAASSESIQVTLVSNGATLEYQDQETQPQPHEKPWDQLLTVTATDPDQHPLEREFVDNDLDVIEREPTEVKIVSTLPTALEPLAKSSPPHVLDMPLPTDTTVSTPPAREAAQATPIATTNPPRNDGPAASADRDQPVEPQVTESAPRPELPGSGEAIERVAEAPKLPRAATDVAELVAQLPDPPNTLDEANLRADRSELLNAVGQPSTDGQANGGDASPAQSGSPSRPPLVAAPMRSNQLASATGNPSDTTGDMATQAIPTRPADGAPLPPIYQLRMDKERDAAVRAGGGSMLTEGAVESALSWLAQNQSASGGWDASQFGSGRETLVLGQDRGGAGFDADTGVSGLVLLAFLGAGHTHYAGEHRETVQKGLEFILRQGNNGDFGGNARTFARMYCHSIALFAVCEAYAMTGDERIQTHAQRAVSYSVAAQNPHDGGWRYRPGDRGDMSQFGWQVMALKSAKLAGLDVSPVCEERMRAFLERCTAGGLRGRAAYRPGEYPSRTMTAEAMLCRLFLYAEPDEAALDEAAQYVSEQLPGESQANLYYWYYATLALQQLGGERWDRWNAALQDALLRRQSRQGTLAGSWDADTVWGSYGGRVYTTAMAALCLEAYYRYSPGAPGIRQASRDTDNTD